MNTTEKGNNFELKVHDIIENQQHEKQFSLMAPFYELFHQKGYYSRDRPKYIDVDLSIEFRRTKDSSPGIYIFIECKDYTHTVPVDDVEELFAKTEQIAGVNVKAMLFSRSHLQEGAFNYAKSKGIAVIRILDDDSLSWLIERTNKNLVTTQANSMNVNVVNALTNEYFVSTQRDTFASVNGQVFYTVEEVLTELLKEADLSN